jgi:hypothetical protein
MIIRAYHWTWPEPDESRPCLRMWTEFSRTWIILKKTSDAYRFFNYIEFTHLHLVSISAGKDKHECCFFLVKISSKSKATPSLDTEIGNELFNFGWVHELSMLKVKACLVIPL